jgi:hypothetical protein
MTTSAVFKTNNFGQVCRHERPNQMFKIHPPVTAKKSKVSLYYIVILNGIGIILAIFQIGAKRLTGKAMKYISK